MRKLSRGRLQFGADAGGHGHFRQRNQQAAVGQIMHRRRLAGRDQAAHKIAVAALGGEIEVPSLSGKLKLRVPPATQAGSVLRMKGKGIPHRYRGGHGDQLVEVGVEVPTELTPRAQALIEELGRELGEIGERFVQGMVASTAMRRPGQPDEVAATIAYLASDDASFVTGETIGVSGGLGMM